MLPHSLPNINHLTDAETREVFEVIVEFLSAATQMVIQNRRSNDCRKLTVGHDSIVSYLVFAPILDSDSCGFTPAEGRISIGRHRSCWRPCSQTQSFEDGLLCEER